MRSFICSNVTGVGLQNNAHPPTETKIRPVISSAIVAASASDFNLRLRINNLRGHDEKDGNRTMSIMGDISIYIIITIFGLQLHLIGLPSAPASLNR